MDPINLCVFVGGKKTETSSYNFSDNKYNFSATSNELLSSPQIGGAYNSSEGDSISEVDSDASQFRIKGTRVIE